MEQLEKLHARVRDLEEALFKVYEAAGADTDGATRLSEMGKLTPPIEVLALEAVRELRNDYEVDEDHPICTCTIACIPEETHTCREALSAQGAKA